MAARRVIADQRIEDIGYDENHDLRKGMVVEGIEFRNCVFSHGNFSVRDPKDRPIIRDCAFIDCEVTAGFKPKRAIFEDVFVENLKLPSDGIWMAYSVFRRCILRGKIGRFAWPNQGSTGIDIVTGRDDDARFYAANQAYYAEVARAGDFALDISQADFESYEAEEVPGRLVKFDPKRDVLVTRESIAGYDDEYYDQLGGESYLEGLFNAVADGEVDAVVISPGRGRPEDRKLVENLYRLGLADVPPQFRSDHALPSL